MAFTDRDKPPVHSVPDDAAMYPGLARILLKELHVELEWQSDRKWTHLDITEKHKQWQRALEYTQKQLLLQEINECKRLKELAVKQQDFDRACMHRDQIDRLRIELDKR